jgi:alkaline phosphatase D
MLRATSLVLVAVGVVATVAAAEVDSPFELASVGVGSCNKHERDQQYWGRLGDAIARRGPPAADATVASKTDGFIWLGDVVYNDHSPMPFVWRADTLEHMTAKMQTFRASPYYDNFVSNRVAKHPGTGRPQVVGVWDDHDMGKNDGGREYEMRKETQRLFLDFLDVPAADARRRSRDGVYSAHGFPMDRAAVDAVSGSLSAESRALLQGKEFAICTILLDGRSGREALGSNGDMLGEEQWQWLDAVIADPTEEFGGAKNTKKAGSGGGAGSLFDRCLVTIIGSGVQVVSDEKPTEHWGHFPASRARLTRLLHKHRAERFVFFSGDVHYAEIQQVAAADSPFGFPIVDVTTSGMTHAVGDFLPAFLFDFFCASNRRLARYLPRNFGRAAVAVDASGRLLLNMTVHSIKSGQAVLQHAVPVASLVFGAGATPAVLPCKDACDLSVNEGLLKWLLFGFRRTFAPDMPVHRLLSGFVVVALVGLGACGALGLRLYRRRRGCLSASARRAPKTD